MKLYKIMNTQFQAAFNKLVEVKGLKGSVMLKLAKLTQKVAEEGQAYDKIRVKLCEELAEKTEDGKPVMTEDNQYKISQENIAILNEKINELMNTEIEFPVLKFNIDDLEKANLTTVDVLALGEFIIEE